MTNTADAEATQAMPSPATGNSHEHEHQHHHSSPLGGLVAGYGRESHLGPYLVLVGSYVTFSVVGAATAVRRRGRTRVTFTDGALLAVGAFRLSRLVSKNKVAGVVRAPFTRWVEPGDGAEVNEAPRGEGMRHAIGELLTCPFCLTQWSATALGVAWLHAPEATRTFNSLLAAASAADVMHVAWTRIETLA